VLVYLHGFASGPASTKAQFFKAQLADRGIELAIPDLAPDFTHLTISSMLAIVEPLVAREPGVLIGSSLGGYVAALTAARHPERVRGLVLFAPAFDFAGLWEASIGPAAVARWRERKILPVHHYGRGRKELLSVELLDDARRYPDEPDPPGPALIFAGRHDQSVPLAAVERFARRRPERTLIVHESGHELTDVLEPMWERTATFLRALGTLPA
jgi:uncharacterized protein